MFPPVDESRDRLHRAGWSVAAVAGIGGWPECRSNGEHGRQAPELGFVHSSLDQVVHLGP
jgi:hypothetical protein